MRLDPPEPNHPPVCEDCEYSEDNGKCPLDDDFGMCPMVFIVDECDNCGKPLNVVPGKVPFHISGFDTMYGCSERCRDALENQIHQEAKDMGWVE